MHLVSQNKIRGLWVIHLAGPPMMNLAWMSASWQALFKSFENPHVSEQKQSVSLSFTESPGI